MVKETVAEIDQDARVILFGSRARGDFRAESDWDFLILTREEASWELQDKIRELLYSKVELESDQVISSVVENQEIWQQYRETEFFNNVNAEGIEIVFSNAV